MGGESISNPPGGFEEAANRRRIRWICKGPNTRQDEPMMKTAVPMIVTALLLAGALSALSWDARGVENTSTNVTGSLKRSTYPLVAQGLVSSDTYVPGDSINFTITGDGVPDAANDIFDIQVFRAPARQPADRITTLFFNDIALVNGRATVTLDGAQTKYLADQTYYLGVYPQNYDTSGFTGINRLTLGDMSFKIQLYYFDVQAQRRGFIPGETVQIAWSALNLKDSTPSNGQNGAWLFNTYTASGCTPAITRTGTFTSGTGTFNVTFDNLANPSCTHTLNVWYNGTTDGGNRAGFDFFSTSASTFSPNFWWLAHLSGSITFTSSPNTFPATPGSVGSVTVKAYVQDNAFPVRNQYPVPDADVKLNFTRVDGTLKTTLAGPGGTFKTDGRGTASYAFLLSDPFTAGNTYNAQANISKILESAVPSPTTSFSVGQPVHAIVTTLLLDKGGYYAGDTASISVQGVAPPGDDSTFSYTFDVYLCSSSSACPQSGSTISEVDHVRMVTSVPVYSYSIRQGFTGYLKVMVAVSNQAGDYGSASQTVGVLGVDLAVNANPTLYKAGDRVTISYTTTLASPTFLYVVSYPGGGGSIIATQGSTTATSFSWDVPQSGPPSSYTTTVYAYSNGQTASQSVTVSLQGGIALEISPDKGAYGPGDTMNLGFKLTAIGNSRLPESVLVVVSVGGISSSFRSLKTENTMTFVLPSTLNTGDQGISATAYDGATGAWLASANEVISIRGLAGNPLWFSRLADMPIVEWILVGLVAILFIFGIRSGMIPFPGKHGAHKAPKSPKGGRPPQTPPDQGQWSGPPP